MCCIAGADRPAAGRVSPESALPHVQGQPPGPGNLPDHAQHSLWGPLHRGCALGCDSVPWDCLTVPSPVLCLSAVLQSDLVEKGQPCSVCPLIKIYFSNLSFCLAMLVGSSREAHCCYGARDLLPAFMMPLLRLAPYSLLVCLFSFSSLSSACKHHSLLHMLMA